MKNYKENDYALNKYSQGIIYKFVDGVLEVTLEDYLRDNPDKTEDDFLELKALSDEIYREQAVEEQRTGRLDISMEQVAEDELAVTISSLDEKQRKEEEGERALDAARRLLQSEVLTEVQRRRFILYYFQGFSIRRIAKLEGVHQRAVWDSLTWAEKKLKKFFKE